MRRRFNFLVVEGGKERGRGSGRGKGMEIGQVVFS